MNFICLTVLVVTLMVYTIEYVRGGTIQNENELYDVLLNTGYNKYILPRENTKTPVTVNVTFSLLGIKEFDEVDGKFSVIGYLYVSWMDPRMTWKAWKYNGTDTMRFVQTEVWVPPITLVNPFEKINTIGEDFFTVMYTSEGQAYWFPGDVITSHCQVDVTHYPFDTQTCLIIFNCWGMGVTEVKLQAITQEVDTREYTKHGTWDLTETGLFTITDFVYTVGVTFTMKRRPTFVITTVISPILCVLILDILVFILPVDSGERVSFSITVLLALSVFLTLVGETLPKTSEPMSVLSFFLLTALGLSAISCFMTVVCIKIYYNSVDNPVPMCIQRLLRMCCCSSVKSKKKKKRPRQKTDVFAVGIQNLDNLKIYDDWSEVSSLKSEVTWQDVSNFVDKIMIVFNTLAMIAIIVAFYVLVLKE